MHAHIFLVSLIQSLELCHQYNQIRSINYVDIDIWVCSGILDNSSTHINVMQYSYRLQYFAHGCQVYHNQLEVTLKKNINKDARNVS